MLGRVLALTSASRSIPSVLVARLVKASTERVHNGTRRPNHRKPACREVAERLGRKR
jgi:hypothetical protein